MASPFLTCRVDHASRVSPPAVVEDLQVRFRNADAKARSEPPGSLSGIPNLQAEDQEELASSCIVTPVLPNCHCESIAVPGKARQSSTPTSTKNTYGLKRNVLCSPRPRPHEDFHWIDVRPAGPGERLRGAFEIKQSPLALLRPL